MTGRVKGKTDSGRVNFVDEEYLKKGTEFMKDITDIEEGFELEGTPDAENEFKKVEVWKLFKITKIGQALSGIVDHIAQPDEFNRSAMLFLKDVNGVNGQNIKMFLHKDLEFKFRNVSHVEGKKVLIKLVDKTVTNEGRELNVYELKVKE